MHSKEWITIRRKLIAGFGLIIGCYAAAILLAVSLARGLVELTTTIYEHPLEVSNASLRASLGVARIHNRLHQLLESGDDSVVRELESAIILEEETVFRNLDLVRERILGREGEILEQKARKSFENWRRIRPELLRLVRSGDRREAHRRIMHNGASMVSMLEGKMLSLTEYARNKADGFMAQALVLQRRLLLYILLAGLAGTVLAGVVAFLALKSVFVFLKQRQETEEFLRVNEERYRELFDRMGSGVAVYEPRNRGREFYFLDFNRAAERIDRINREEVVGRNVEEVFPGVRDFGLLDVLQEVWRTGKPAHHPISRYQDDRLQGWRENYIYPLSTGEIVAVYDDVTARKQAEEKVARYRDHLEELVGQRTAALEKAQEELVRRERLAALGQLTGTVAHELRNPLGTIRGSAYLVCEQLKQCEGPVRQALDRIERNVLRCDRIIEELFDYTRSLQPVLQTLTIDVFLASLLADLDLPQGIELERHLAAPVTVAADPEMLRRCLINLITNACEAMLEAGGTTEDGTGRERGPVVSVTSIVDDGWVEIRIRDTGPGIPPDILERIFEPLFSTRGFGVGLGLTIVGRIVEIHNGGVGVESTGAEGTCFLVRLPISDSPEPARDMQT